MSTAAIYLSMLYGERLRIGWDYILDWAVDYGDSGYSMALSADSNYLIAGSFIGSIGYIGKLNSAAGTVLASYSS